MKLRRIQKRDGREVPFDKTKISDAVARAQGAVGEADPHFAAEVADVVELALLRRYPQGRLPHTPEHEAVPGIEEIQDLVEQALIELGHAAVAKAYILYRDRRARIRAALQVRGGSDRHANEPVLEAREPEEKHARRRTRPRVQDSGGVATWSKGRIVVALMNEGELPRATAEQVAARVEEREVDSGLERISTALIRELVDNELVELGLSQALRRQRPVVVPRHDLRRLLADPTPRAAVEALPAAVLGREPFGARPAHEVLAGTVLGRFALEDLLPESVAELHLSGELFFENLEAPHLALTQTVPAELLLSNERTPEAAFEILEELARLSVRTSYGVVVEDAQILCAPFVRPARGGTAPTRGGTKSSSALASFLLALSATARASARAIDLAFAPLTAHAQAAAGSARPSGARSSVPSWFARLVEELGELATRGDRTRLSRLFVDGDDLAALLATEPALRSTVDRLLAAGLVVPTWGVAGERFAGPGLARAWREKSGLACAGACAVNLVRAARRAGPWREDALLENAARSIESALDGLAALAEHQRRERWLEEAQRGLVRGRASYVITPVGLREALRFVADGELRPEQAARLASFLGEAVQRFSRSRGLSVVLSPWFGERAAQRFAALDRELFQVSQPLLFDGETGHDFGGLAPYSTGLDLSPSTNVANVSALEAAEAALCATLKSGALHPPAILRALAQGPLEDRPSVSAAWERLERTRSRLRSGAWALYALSSPEDDPATVEEDPGADLSVGADRSEPLFAEARDDEREHALRAAIPRSPSSSRSFGSATVEDS